MVAVYDRQCRYRLVNRAFEVYTSMPRQRCVGRSIGEVFGPDEQVQCWPWMERALAGETVSYEMSPVALPGRHVFLSYVPLRLPDGQIDGFVCVGQDITEHREETRRLVSLSERDPLTGLLNRVGLDEAMKRCEREGQCDSMAVLYADLDGFKPVNDRYGHAAGDEILRQFALRLTESLRPTDLVARVGGDEFVVVLPGVRAEGDAMRVSEKIAALAGRPYDVQGRSVTVGASVGVAHQRDLAGGWRRLLERADVEMYRVKEQRGRQESAVGEQG
jgi:diguanylate cyclase (GGDEF)-like protein/PAS domain S-box-containing protein